jgi:AmmeMemoRadiSam system protein B
MIRLPAVAGRFYPLDPAELRKLVLQFSKNDLHAVGVQAMACLVPHAGYAYSGPVTGAVFARLALPKKVLILGVRHFPGGEKAAINSRGAWQTPLGDVAIDEELAGALRLACPILQEDPVAHSREHSLEVQLPFLQVLAPASKFVPIALGSMQFEECARVGEALGAVLRDLKEQVLLLATSDLNHYEDDRTTRVKDRKAIEALLGMDPRRLYDACRVERISMCGWGPAVAMLSALKNRGAQHAELVRYATSADVTGDTSSVVGYAGMIFS